MAGHHLIAARLAGDDHGRLQHSEFLYAVHQVHHVLVVLDVERMALKGVYLRHLQRGDDLRLPLPGDGERKVLGDFVLGGLIGRGGGRLFSPRLFRLGGVGVYQLAGNGQVGVFPVFLAVAAGVRKGHFVNIRPDFQHTGLFQRLAAMETVYKL